MFKNIVLLKLNMDQLGTVCTPDFCRNIKFGLVYLVTNDQPMYSVDEEINIV